MCFKNITKPFFLKRKTSIRAITLYHAALHKHCIRVYVLCTEDRLFLAIRLPDTQLNREPVSGNYRRDSMGGYSRPRQNILLMYYIYTHHIKMKSLHREMIHMEENILKPKSLPCFTIDTSIQEQGKFP